MNLFKLFLLFFLLFVVIFVVTRVLDRDEAVPASVWVEPVFFIDVRTPEEFNEGHYPGAKNIPLSGLASKLNQFNPDEGTYVVYCRSGNRSGQAISILKQHGIHNTVNGINQQTLNARKVSR